MISIIIPTYNGAKKILNALHALEQQTFKDFEVIVVVDGSTDNTVEILKGKSFELQNFKLIVQENKGRAAVRNRGALEASSELLIFFDDDTRPQPSCIQNHYLHHISKPGSIAVGHVPEDALLCKTDFQKYKLFLTNKWTSNWQEVETKIPLDKPYLTAANFSIGKNLFNYLNGFDENLTDAEDFDLGVRVAENKIETFFLSKAIAFHDDYLSARSYILRLRQYKISHDKLKNKKPALYDKYNQYEYKNPGFIKKLVYKMFSYKIWVDLIDSNNIPLPKFILYKCYDIITTSLGVFYLDKKI